MGTDGSWPASRSARSHPGRAKLAWTETRRSASVSGGGCRRGGRGRGLGEYARFSVEHLRDVELEHGAGFGFAFGRGETPRAGVETRTEEDHLRGGESRERGEDGVVEESGADGDASLVAVPARADPREGLLAGERGGEGVDEERGRVRALGLERAERGDGLGRVGDRLGEFLRRSRRRVAATPAKESREEREDQRGRGERNRAHPNVDGTTRARRGVRAPGARPTKLMRETRRRSSLLDITWRQSRHLTKDKLGTLF